MRQKGDPVRARDRVKCSQRGLDHDLLVTIRVRRKTVEVSGSAPHNSSSYSRARRWHKAVASLGARRQWGATDLRFGSVV